MPDQREKGLEIVRKMLPPEYAGPMEKGPRPGAFGGELSELSLRMVFAELWTRPGLDMRSRSLVTLGILIALRAENEFQVHVRNALRNGVTRGEIEEIIYHSTGYAGFPAATAARAAAVAALAKEDADPAGIKG